MDCTGLYLSELDFAVLYWSSLDGTGLLQLVDCTTLYWAVLDCTRLYSAVPGLAVLGSPGGPGDPGDPGGKSVPVDSSGQGGWGD